MVITRVFRPVLLILVIVTLSLSLPLRGAEFRPNDWQEQNALIAGDHAFLSGFELFYRGPEWFLNALSNPGGTRTINPRLARMSYDRSGDRVIEAAYVGPLRDTFDLNGFTGIMAFASISSQGNPVPFAPLAPTATKFWDVSAGAGNGVGGSGTWTLQTDLRWSDSSTGDATLSAAAATDAGVFEGTAGTVSIAGDLSLASWTFNTTNYVLTPSSGTARTLTGSFSLAAGVNLNIGDAAKTTDSTFSLVGSGVTGDAGSGLTLQGAQVSTDGRAVRIQLSQAGASIDVPITISGTGTTAAGIIGNATGTGVTGTITNNSGFLTLLGATTGNDLTLSSAAVISGTAGVRIGLNASTGDNAGTVTLNAASSYTGGTTLDGGTLVLGNDTALGTNTLTLSNSTSSVLQAGGGARTLANNIVWGGNGTLSGSNAFTFNGTFTSSGAASRSITVSNTGGLTINGNVFLAPNNTDAGGLTVNGTTAVTINGVIANNSGANTLAKNLTKSGVNTLTLTNANTYTGSTTISGGTLDAAATNSLGGTSTVAVSGGGTLLFSGATTNRINDAATMTLNGGTLNTAGLSEHGAMNNDAGIGALTLASSSIIDLASGASILAFANSSAQTWTGTLSIYNYSGTAYTGNGTDQLYFGNSTAGLTSAQLLQINFYSDNGTTLLGFGGWGTDNDGEVVPVPEPSTWIGAALALAAIGLMSRKARRAKSATSPT